MRNLGSQLFVLCLLFSGCAPTPQESVAETVEQTPAPPAGQEVEVPTFEESPEEPVEVDWILIADLERAASDLEMLIEEARSELMVMGEVEGEAMPGRARLEAEWTLWSRAWFERMAHRGSSLPSIDFDVRPPELLYALQALERGWHEMDLLPTTAYSWTNVPSLPERERHLDTAQAAVEEARELLGQIER